MRDFLGTTYSRKDPEHTLSPLIFSFVICLELIYCQKELDYLANGKTVTLNLCNEDIIGNKFIHSLFAFLPRTRKKRNVSKKRSTKISLA